MHEAEVHDRPGGRVARFREAVELDLTLRHDLAVDALGDVDPEAARPNVRVDCHREELLSLRVADDRLDSTEDLEGGRARENFVVHVRSRLIPKATWTSSGVRASTASV